MIRNERALSLSLVVAPSFGSKKFPDADFTATPAMVAVVGDGKKKNCKYELEQAAKGGWHQGQLFYYR